MHDAQTHAGAKRLWLIVGFVLVPIVVTLVVLLRYPDPQVGDCLTDIDGAVRTKIVDCDDPAAAYEVVNTLPPSFEQTKAEAERLVCAGHPRGEPYVGYSKSRLRGGVKLALCAVRRG